METVETGIEMAGQADLTQADRLPDQANARIEKGGPDSLRVLMAAGGTGGHIFPALAVADALTARGRRSKRTGATPSILFLGTGRGLESRVIPAGGYPLRTVRAAGLKGIGGLRKLLNFLLLPRSGVEAAMVLREFQPDVVMGIGGYLAGPVVLEAALKDIPTLLLEPNAIPGFTNLILAPVVRVAAVAFEETARFYGAKARVTGHPVREAFSKVPSKEHVPPFTVLLLGGSQGSAAINDCVVRSLPLLTNETGRLRLVHQTGERDYNAVRAAYRERGFNAEVHTFIENMPEAFARADLIVTRAGATTVAELCAAGKAALLVPFPHATDHHQLANSQALERVGAARLIEQAVLTPARLVKELCYLLDHPERMAEMERGAKRLARPDAAERIAELIEDLAVGRQPSTMSDTHPAED